MKIKKIKNCNGCRGFFVSNGHVECTCGVDIRTVGRRDTTFGELVNYAPTDGVCYKPRTCKEYCEACRLGKGGEK